MTKTASQYTITIARQVFDFPISMVTSHILGRLTKGPLSYSLDQELTSIKDQGIDNQKTDDERYDYLHDGSSDSVFFHGVLAVQCGTLGTG
jgi:hypothetical protein